MHAAAEFAAPAIQCLLTPPRQSAAGHAPKDPFSTHQGRGLHALLLIASANFRAFTSQLAVHITPVIRA
eukprot:1159010-Pelagomonas_calceolata.AAC.6